MAAGFLGLMIAVRVVWRQGDALPLSARITTLITIPTLVMLAGTVLARADWVRGQARGGQPVGRLSGLFFGAGVWSLMIWGIAALLVGFPLAIWLGSLTSGRPAG